MDRSRTEIARSYIDALVSHDSSGVPFASGARRIEMGIKTGFSGPRLARDLNRGPHYRVIRGVRNLETSESGDTVTADFVIDVGTRQRRLLSVAVHETFQVPDGTIHLIRARLRLTRA